MLRTASCPASMAGPIAVRSTQFGGGSCRILCGLWRQQWVEDFRYVALADRQATYRVAFTLVSRSENRPLQNRVLPAIASGENR